MWQKTGLETRSHVGDDDTMAGSQIEGYVIEYRRESVYGVLEGEMILRNEENILGSLWLGNGCLI